MNVAAVPCTCGELFQGAIDGMPCLASCPVDVYSTGVAAMSRRSASSMLSRKTNQALEWLWEKTGRRVSVSLDSPLPPGRGYGTSTADIGAALFSASRTLQFDLPAIEAAQVAARIEPTDSTFFPGIALFDHRYGSFHEILGAPPFAWLAVLDPGGVIDTESFNARDWQPALKGLAAEHRCAYRLLQQGIAGGDLHAIGEAATLSAVCHQRILFNPVLETAKALASQLGAVGVCRAHSGTVLGLIFPERADIDSLVRYISRKLSGIVQVRKTSLVGGGARYPAEEQT